MKRARGLRPVCDDSMLQRRGTVVLAAALVALTSVPYLYAHVSTPSTLVYTGLLFDVPDHAQYWSWVTASRKGLFISNTMTPEPNAPSFMNPTMWLLARAQVAFGLSFPALFQCWRIAAILALVPALVAFVRTMVVERERQATTLIVALFGSGFGWALILAKKIGATGELPWPNDVYTVEANTFWAMLGYPYISLAHALILVTMVGVWLAYRGRGWGFGLMAGGAAAALSMSHAYDLITVYAVLAAYGLVAWVRDRRFPTRLAAVGLLVGACSAPAALYYQRLTSQDPLWRSILAQYANAGVWTPPHLHLIILMGAPLLLAVCGAISRGRWTEERWFAVTWVAVGLVLIYLPVVYQIKLLSGWQFPIAILAAYGWHERIRPAFDRRHASTLLALVALVVLVSATNIYLFAWRFVDLRRHTVPYFLHRDEVDALGWLSEHADASDVVLARGDVGQFVPNYGGSRAYLAHWAMTDRFFERRTNVQTFFAPETSDAWREHLLAHDQVTLILRTDWPEAATSAYDPNTSQSFELLFGRPHAQIYRFRPRESATLATRSPQR